MKKKNFIIRGKIIDSNSKKGISGLKVEAWDKNIFKDKFLGHQFTGVQGAFQIEISEKKMGSRILDKYPDLYFKIYYNEELIHSTLKQIYKNYRSSAKRLIISIDWQSEETYSVSGAVKTEKNIPAPNFIVRGYDIKIGKELYLGKAITDELGQFYIDYSSIMIKFPKSQAIDLQVKVFKNDTPEVELGNSNIVLNAKRSEWIHVTISANAYEGPSEFEHMEKEINKLLKPANYPDLNEEDIDYIAVKLNFSTNSLKHYFHAWKLSNEANEFKQIQVIPTAIFYGVFKDDEFPDLQELVKKEKKILSQDLKRAVTSNRIPAKLEMQINLYVNTLKELAVASGTKWTNKLRPLPNQPTNRYFGKHSGKTKK